MKNLVFLAALLIPTFCFSQKATEYKALNNITYHIGDTVKLGRGSATNGTFMYMQRGGLESLDKNINQPDRLNIGREFTNAQVIIKKIKLKSINGVKKCILIVKGGYLYPFDLTIDDAIQVCEVIPCNKS